MRSEDRLQSWRAIEALRAGVPNRDAVQSLGSAQPAIEERFRKQLAAVREGFSHGSSATGTLIAGDFGSGKSHVLEYLQHVALEENFVCSKVVVSKETPLYDPAKVYAAAIQSAKVPGRTGAALTEIAQRLDDFSSPAYTQFSQWVNQPGNNISTQLAATLFIFERVKGATAAEEADRIIQFWSGGPLTVTELRRWLKELGETATYKIEKASTKDLVAQRYQFIPRLMVAAGYAGWVVLIDEVELISRYSYQQRAKSYAELARLIGKLAGDDIPGFTTVLAITTEFESVVLDGRNDEERVTSRLRARGREGDLLLASQAERGMRIIRQDRLRVEDPTEATIHEIYEKVQALHARAYAWNPPTAYGSVGRSVRIREHIKRWINEWDLKRLYKDYMPDTQIEVLRQDYSENPDLEAPAGDELRGGDPNSRRFEA